ncbi:hypothetical protein VTK26DRAFT_7678 [Humicola hyalothermophila]
MASFKRATAQPTQLPVAMLSPENRAGGAPGTLPTPLVPFSAPFTSQSNPIPVFPDVKSRTLQGPSAKEWAEHRDTIIDLYKQYPLKRVSEIMKKHYGFSASKRMYDKRFREWNVFKNVDRDVRGRASRRTRVSPSSMSPGGIDSNFSPDDLHRTIQCARTIHQGATRPPETFHPDNPTGVETANNTPCPSRPSRGSISISDLITELDLPQIATDSNSFSQTPSPAPDEPFSASETCETPASSCGSAEDHSREQDGSAVVSARSSPEPSLDAYKAQLQRLAMSPPPSLPPDPRTRTMGVITLKLKEYYDWQLQNVPEGVLPDDFLGRRTSEESTRYWTTIKDAIYLVKLSASTMENDCRPDQRAWPAFAEAGTLASRAMTSHPFEFLRNLFTTLSPANTSARPELRGILLQFLTREARCNLAPNYPITRICEELQRDEDCQEISRRGLQCMLDIFNSRLGRSQLITFKLLDSLATLLRRSGEFHAGLKIITELLRACTPVFGPDSDQVREVEAELAHFYMLTDDYDLALSHCMSVVTRPRLEGSQENPSFHQDGISAHAMEDIAEIHQRRGDLEQCITWLERAASIALVVWGPKAVATGHLIDKMTALQRRFGNDLIKSATLWEAAVE